MFILRSCLLLGSLCINLAAHAESLDQHGILRGNDGKVLELTQYEAEKACPVGTRLPTIREFALEANVSRGALGIIEMTAGNQKPPNGYRLERAAGPRGLRDDFFYSSLNCAVADESSNYWFWSSSVHAFYSGEAYSFLGLDCGIEYWARSQKSAVRCIPQ
jgi:hypothetical protein